MARGEAPGPRRGCRLAAVTGVSPLLPFPAATWFALSLPVLGTALLTFNLGVGMVLDARAEPGAEAGGGGADAGEGGAADAA